MSIDKGPRFCYEVKKFRTAFLALFLAFMVFLSLLPTVCAQSAGNFNPPHSDYGLDTDGNFLYNYLVVNVSVSVTSPGNFFIMGDLYDNLGLTQITSTANYTTLPAGNQIVELRFSGYEIYNSGIDGPYQAQLSLFSETGMDFNTHFTDPYSYTEFDPPPATFSPPHYDYGLDTDSPTNGLYNYLVVKVNVSVSIGGTYETYGSLSDGLSNYIDDDSNITFLNTGLQTVELRFYGPAIYGNGENGPYYADLYLYDDISNQLDTDAHTTNFYLYDDFDPPPARFSPPSYDYGLDTDSPPNGLFDCLVVGVNVSVTTAGTYEVDGFMVDSLFNFIDDDTNTSFLNTGLQTVELRFYGPSIYGNGENGPYDVYLTLYDDALNDIDSDTYTTNFYFYAEFDPPPATFSPPHYDYGLDTDSPANGLFNYLVVNVNVSVTTAGTYEVEGFMVDILSNFIDYDSNTSFLNTGIQTVELRFSGSAIYSNGEDGPYDVYLTVYDNVSNQLDSDTYTTNHYLWTDFDPPPVTFSPPYYDFGLDTDSPVNGLYDYLVINVNLSVTTAGNFTIVSYLLDASQSVQIVGACNSTFLNVGSQAMQLYHEGWVIGLMGIDGPYFAQFTLFDEDITPLGSDIYTTNSYLYTEFEATLPSIASHWTDSPPMIDGTYSPGEWSDAAWVDLYSVKGNMINASLFVKNDAENLYICYDAVGDIIQESDDSASISFDTKNDDLPTEGREDQFVVGGISNNQAHYVYSTVEGEWVTEDSPFNNLLPNHATLEAMWGFGGSDNSSVSHRIYEFQIPLALIGTALGDTIGFAGVSGVGPGIMDDMRGFTIWPALFGELPPLSLFGDLVIASFPGGNVPPTLSEASLLPMSGVADSTYFTYRVTYRDANNDPAALPQVWINKSGNPIGGPYSMTLEGWVGEPGNYVSGAVYYYSTKLIDYGTDYTFAFDASDGTVNVFTTEQSGPTVLSVPDPPINLGVQGCAANTAGSLNITDHTPELNWTFIDPDGIIQGGYNLTIWSGPGGTGTLMWWDNQTSPSPIVTYNYDSSGLPLNDGTDYYLRVKTADADGLWGDWAEMKFHMNIPPPAPANFAPSNGVSILQSMVQIVQWESVMDSEGSAVTYYWYVSLVPSFSTLYASGSTPNLNSAQFSTSEGNTYYWRVRAYDGYEFGLNSSIWSFNVTNPPNVPINLGVEGFAAGTPQSLNMTDHTPELNWTFSDPDGDLQGGFNVSVWTGPGGTGTLMWWYNQTSSETSVVYDGLELIDGEDYHLRVKTMDEHGFWGGWAEMKFHMNTPPPAPANFAPSNGISIPQSIAQNVQWESVMDSEGSAVTYYWYVSLAASFSTLHASGSTPNLNSAQFSTSGDDTYYWRVRAYDGYEFGLNSSTWSFNVTNPPNVPINLGVGGFAAGTPQSLSMTDHTPELNWTFSDPDGDLQGGFNVSVWTGPGGTGTLMWWYNQTSSETSVVYDGLELIDGEDYHLRVKTMDEHGFWGDWAEMKFHMNTPPPSPALETPNNGDTELEYGPQELDWEAVIDSEGSAITYEWQISTDPSFSMILAGVSGSGDEASYTTSSSTKYYWRVRAYDGYEWGEYSAVWNFTTTSAKGSISCEVTDEIGGPIQDAKVELYDSTDSLIATIYTDSNGNFTFYGIVIGSGYYVYITKTGYENYTSSTITVDEDQTTRLSDIQLSTEKGSISGNVKDKKGQAISNVKVELIDSDGNIVDTKFTDDEGNFEFDDVEQGTYKIQISKEGYDIYTTEQLTLGPGEQKTVPEIGMSKKGEEPSFPWWIIIVVIIIAIALIALIFLFFKKKV